jgi:hypothetical protein
VKISIPSDDTVSCPAVRAPLVAVTNAPAMAVVESKAPVWSESLKALALEFRQRQVMPSRRNMQLVIDGESACHIFRSGKSEYMIEFRAACALSLTQAVCVFVSSSLWH